MSAFNKLMEEFSAATGVDTVVDGERSCTLEADGILVTLQYLEDADEVVLFAPVWEPEAEGALPSSATMRAALELGYDGKETGGAHIGLFENSLVLSIHLPMADLDGEKLGVRVMAFFDVATGVAATLSQASAGGEDGNAEAERQGDSLTLTSRRT